MKPWLGGLGIALLGLCSGSAALAQQAPQRLAQTMTFDIPAQPIGTALTQFARQAGIQVLFYTTIVSGIRSPHVVGTLTREAALEQLLASTTLSYEFLNERTVAIRARATAPNGPGTGDTGGSPVSKEQTDLLDAAAAEHASAAPPGFENSPFARGNEVVEEITITGSRLARRDEDGPSPVTVLTREDIDRTGAATTREVLNTLSQNAVASDESGNATFLGASTVQLRGLPVGSTLVLLNGRRLGASGANAASNFFDLNNIPLEAVDRIEILSDTASAIYGADAIGGAVNIILQDRFDGAVASARFGTSGEGGGSERSGSLTFGGHGDAYSGLIVLDVLDRDPIRAADRSLTSTRDFTRFGGEDFRSTLSYPANVYALPGTGNLPGLNAPFAAVPAGTDGIGLTAADFSTTAGTLDLFNDAPYATLEAQSDRQSLFATGSRRFSASSLEVFGEMLYTHKHQIVQQGPDALFGGAAGLFIVPADNPFNPFGAPVGVDYRFMELGPRANDSSTDFSRLLIGARGGLFRRFSWDVYVLADRDATAVTNRGAVNRDIAQQFLNSTDPQTALNVFSTTGNNNPDTLHAILDETIDNLTTQARMGEATLRGPLMDLPAGPLQFAIGVNMRREELAFLSPQAGNIRSDRTTKAAFAEVSLPLIGAAQAMPGVRSLELTGAARYDDYAREGSRVSPQFGLLWRPVSTLLVRASRGKAFKLATPFDLFFPQLTLPTVVADPLRNGEPSAVALVFGGNPHLAPEKGDSRTFGIKWEPASAPGFSVAVSAFRVEQRDFITRFSDTDLLLNNADQFPGRVVRAPATPEDIALGLPGRLVSIDQSSVNFGRIVVRGTDAQFEYALQPMRFGQFVTTVSGTYIDDYEVLLTPGSRPINRVSQANDAGYPVRFKGGAALSWSGFDSWSAALSGRYLASYTDYDGERRLPAQRWFDFQVNHHFGARAAAGSSGWDATLGILNLTDNQGDFSNNLNGYDPHQADIRGRYFYAMLKVRF